MEIGQPQHSSVSDKKKHRDFLNTRYFVGNTTFNTGMKTLLDMLCLIMVHYQINIKLIFLSLKIESVESVWIESVVVFEKGKKKKKSNEHN
ncbi:hypothetical protein BpHYR1_039224 [Brachionus plicatilis]|uniref:Uncharacterized protein n=1 Tax=Brachionus plicatilis TaxID=10195 RepID=A0A3M7P9P6_BRAPC|nr:hypothetical protein BpHYR1_039224 [Brachionus plicatilis]